MPQHRRVKELTPEVAAYIAGIIDGEGTITLTRVHATENRRLVVSVANTELPLLHFVRDAIGAGKITRKRVVRSHHTPSFHYFLSSAQALELLRQVLPYLQTYKRARADLALRHYRSLTPRNGKYSPEQIVARSKFEQLFLQLRACAAESTSAPVPEKSDGACGVLDQTP